MAYVGITLTTGSDYSQYHGGLGENYVNVADNLADAWQIWDSGKLPFIHLMFHPGRQPNASIQNIADGMFNDLIDEWLAKLVAYCDTGRKAVVVYLPEMNGNWCVYATDDYSTTDFKRAWDYLVTTAKAMGLDSSKVLFCWAPNDTGWEDLEAWYPGDTVDIVGASAYNWGSIFPGEPWESFTQLADRFVREVRPFTDRRIVITQTGAGLNDPRTPAWLDDAVFYTKNYTNIEAFIYFDIDMFALGAGTDWNAQTAPISGARPDHWFIPEESEVPDPTPINPTRNIYYPKQGDTGYVVEEWQVKIVEVVIGERMKGNSNITFIQSKAPQLTPKVWDQEMTDYFSDWTRRNSYGVGPTEAIMVDNALSKL